MYIRALLIIGLLCISACGWHLRGSHSAQAPSELNLVSADPYAALALAFRENMQQQGISNNNVAPLQLKIGSEQLSKRTVAVTNIGSPSQYELSLSVEYQYYLLTESESVTLPRTISVQRVFDYDPNNTVAKNEEENTLIEEMRRELARRIISFAARELGPQL